MSSFNWKILMKLNRTQMSLKKKEDARKIKIKQIS
jgi:hypothetical protein